MPIPGGRGFVTIPAREIHGSRKDSNSAYEVEMCIRDSNGRIF